MPVFCYRCYRYLPEWPELFLRRRPFQQIERDVEMCHLRFLCISHYSGFKAVQTVLSTHAYQAIVKDRKTKPSSVQVCSGTEGSQGKINNKFLMYGL